jgi:hypothetical protein
MMTNRAQRCDNIRTQRAARENAGKRRGGLAAGGLAGWRAGGRTDRQAEQGAAEVRQQQGRRGEEARSLVEVWEAIRRRRAGWRGGASS